ncbi:uncharacterized protein HaLaN_15658 [Haematococcus lacustris]|uniref:Uncharacterized protein n=1 Tax=Haematococcus lacustris TaxID=44745 RepID=A0A699Z812_HAELA|nr:uncharacterized protein HaLaN_15658 [Haematococcus lacustris]
MLLQLPTLSVKAACWRLMAAGVRGFNVSRTRARDDGGREDPALDQQLRGDVFYFDVVHPGVRGFNVSRTRARDDGGREDPALDQQLRGDVFYFDVVHPDGNTGHRAMADLVIQLFADATKGPSRRRPAHAAHNALPPPMIPGNWESRSDKCFIASFSWMNDQAPDKRAKWGFIASQPGAQIRLKLDTTTSAKSLLEGAQDQDLVTIEVAHLRSYAGMGMASVECLSGCTCSPTILDGHHQARVSLVALHEVVATQAAQCVLQVTVLAGTKDPTGGHKVKLTGVMVSDEGGVDSRKAKGLGVFGALDYVTSGLGPKNTFELRQTIHATL